jgi:DNA-binding CsgD family transcriptional regulator
MEPSPERPWRFMGRGPELERLRQMLLDVNRPGVVVAGPAGVGKTRLALECLTLVSGAQVVSVRATATRAAAEIPFGALAHLLPAVDLDTAGAYDRTDLLRRFAAALVERARGRRLVLCIDDAHLLDAASATLIYQLAITNGAFVLATLRAGEPASDPVVSLWKDGLVERIELEGLPTREMAELVSDALRGPIDPSLGALLAERCQGNVLFCRELVLGALAEGTLYKDEGMWRLVGSLRPSARLIELVEARLANLATVERALLEIVSFNESLGTAELAALGDPVLADNLERQGLLSSTMDGRRLQVVMGHPLYGDVLRARLPVVRRRAIARTLTEVIEAAGARRREDALRVGSWRLVSGGGSAQLMLAAASIARWHYDFPFAERLVRAALEAGAGFESELLAAQLAGLQGRSGEAENGLADLATRAEDDAQRGRIAIARLDNFLYANLPVDALRVAEDATATISDVGWLDEIEARRSTLFLTSAGPTATAAVAEPLLQRATGRALAWAHLTGAHSVSRVGRLNEALELTARGYSTQLALVSPLEWYPWFHLFTRCAILAFAGRLQEAEDLAREQYEQGLADRSREAQAYFASQLAMILVQRGRAQTAARHGQEAATLFRELHRPMFMGAALAYLAHAHALAGRPRDAAAALSRFDESSLRPDAYYAVELMEARAWTAAMDGRLSQACEMLEGAATFAREIGDLVYEAAAFHGLARLGKAKDVAERLTALASRVDGELAPARAAHVQGLAARDGHLLEEVSANFERLGADLLAAEAAADAAAAWRRTGHQRKSAGLAGRAALLLSRCECACTPALQLGARARLTPSEREAALLAASGRSNKQIAQDLFLSVRSVENRLQHAYQKLGVSGRDELADALNALRFNDAG